MKKSKGFTLIELLAVLTILSLIVLITVPIVVDVIGEARIESDKRSIELYASAINNAISRYQLNELGEDVLGAFTADGKVISSLENPDMKLTLEYNGNTSCKTIKIHEDGSIYLTDCTVNGESVDYIYTGDEFYTPAKSFVEDSWGTIRANVKAGNLSKYNVGDTKEIELTGFGTYTVRIANISTPEECSQEGFSQSACGFVIEFTDGITDYNMNPTSTNVGGWPASEMRRYLNDTIYKSLPKELRYNITETTVVSSHGSSDSANFTSIDKLYLLSLKEVWGNKTYRNEDNIEANVENLLSAADKTRQLDYYQGISFSDHNKTIKKNNNGQSAIWWLRSCIKNNNQYFSVITSRGLYSNSTAYRYESDAVVSPAFRIW